MDRHLSTGGISLNASIAYLRMMRYLCGEDTKVLSVCRKATEAFECLTVANAQRELDIRNKTREITELIEEKVSLQVLQAFISSDVHQAGVSSRFLC